MLNFLGVEMGLEFKSTASQNLAASWEHAQIADCSSDLLAALNYRFEDLHPLPAGWENSGEAANCRRGLLKLLRAEFQDKPLWGFKDPRACRLVPLWNGIFDELGVVPGYILVARHPDEVAASLSACGGFSYNQSLLLWLNHMLQAERQTRARHRVLVTFDQILSDWRRQAWKIACALGLSYPRSLEKIGDEIDELLDPSLRHHRVGPVATAGQAVCMRGADSRLARWAFKVYHLLAAAAADKYSRVDPGELDVVAREFNASALKLAAANPAREKAALAKCVPL
jgi:hypothetical protein